jgi:hypothetical protein
VKGVRWSADIGPDGAFEGKCEACLEWWPLDLDNWYPRRSLTHCRVCELTKTRLRLAKWREAPEVRARINESSRAYYQYAKKVVNAKRNEARRVRRLVDPEFAEKERSYQREWMRRYRERKAA